MLLNDYQLIFKPFGARAILIEWPSVIDKNILDDVLIFKKSIESHYVKEKVYINSAYNSLLMNYVFNIDNIYDEISILKSLYNARTSISKSVFKLWKIPVCYQEEFALDLEEISIKNKLSKTHIIELHTQAIYTVFFIGFLPGFIYLGGLDKLLHFSRKNTPRLHVKKGAVGIGEQQTGIYPQASPGGWNIIGNSPISFFDIKNTEPCFAKAGDQIQFFNVGIEEYHRIKNEVEEGTYQIKNKLIE